MLAELSGTQEMCPIRLYFRACSPEPFDGYVWLPDGVWGSFEEARDHLGEGTWTFWRGTTPIGALEGTGAIWPSR